MTAPDDTDAARTAQRASSFGALADAYEAHRPDYPAAAVRWSLEPVAHRPAPRVLDLAAGTGKLTRSLLALGADVVAVEPDPQMLAALRRLLPGVEAHQGRAEAIPLPDACVDAVVVGQAIHWFDRELAYPEIARVLRPGGVLGGLWNTHDRELEWVVGLDEAARRPAFDAADFKPPPEPADSPFASVEEAEFRHSQPRTAASLTETFATMSHIAVMPDQERRAALDTVRAYLDSRPFTAGGEFAFPLITRCRRWLLPAAGG